MLKNKNGFIQLLTMLTSTLAVLTLSTTVILSSYDSPKSAQETIAKASFSGFSTDIDCVEVAFSMETMPEFMGEQFAMNNIITEAQACNFLAKGATTSLISEEIKEYTWLSRSKANAMQCTRIEKESAKEAIGINLPERTINTYGATNVEMSYFVANNGYIFVWPPFYNSYDGLFYINESICVKTPEGNIISGDDESLMYKDGFEFDVRGVTIKVSNKPENIDNILKGNVTVEELKDMASIYYKDGKGASAPKGIESEFIYDSRTGSNPSKISSVVKD